MGAISCQEKYLSLIFFCLFAGWGEQHGKHGWREAGEDMCGRSEKVALFEIVRLAGFNFNRNAHEDILTYAKKKKKKKHFFVLCEDIHIYIQGLRKVQNVFMS
jgi:hypothetical protein